jgi:Uma2 family endonuclease
MQKVVDELKLTCDDLECLGESNQRIELYDGELVMSAMPIPLHQLIGTNLTVQLHSYVRKRKLGVVLGSPIDVVLSKHVKFQPDITFLSNERASINDGKRYTAAPDLVVEILSDSTEEKDRTLKFREYARGGASEYWLVSTIEKQIEVYRNSETGFKMFRVFTADENLSTPLFPDAKFDLREVFVV